MQGTRKIRPSQCLHYTCQHCLRRTQFRITWQIISSAGADLCETCGVSDKTGRGSDNSKDLSCPNPEDIGAAFITMLANSIGKIKPECNWYCIQTGNQLKMEKNYLLLLELYRYEG